MNKKYSKFILNDFEEYTDKTTKYKIEWKWENYEHNPDLLETVRGDCVANIDAFEEEDVFDCVYQIISKTLSYAEENIKEDTRFILICWDYLYATFTIVYTNADWQSNSCYIVVCHFRALDKYYLYKLLDDDGNDEYTLYLEETIKIEEMIVKATEAALRLPHISNIFKQLKEKGIRLCYTDDLDRDFIREIIIDSDKIKYQVIKN